MANSCVEGLQTFEKILQGRSDTFEFIQSAKTMWQINKKSLVKTDEDSTRLNVIAG